MEDLILWVCRLFSLLTAIYGVYFAVISVFCLKRDKPDPEAGRQLRFAALIPARNEECCIATLVKSLHRQNYPRELVDVFVIPNNCTDGTAEAALAAGARLLTVSPRVHSKGQALHELLLNCFAAAPTRPTAYLMRIMS